MKNLSISETKVYISGTDNLTELPAAALTLIDDIIAKKYVILLGDQDGLDSLLQSYISSKYYQRVIVYGQKEIKNNLAFNQVKVAFAKSIQEVKEFTAEEAHFGLAIINNNDDLEIFNKYLSDKTKIINILNKPTPEPQKRIDLFFIKQYLSPSEQQQLVNTLRSTNQDNPLFTPQMPNGAKFKISMTSFGHVGWVSSIKGYRYTVTHPVTGRPWLPIPDFITTKSLDIAYKLDELDYQPQTCLMNLYKESSKLGLHQDNSEPNKSAPIISFSLGDTAIFMLKTDNKIDEFLLESGDLFVLEGELRMAYHGIKQILSNTSSLLKTGGRINLTIRQVFNDSIPNNYVKKAFFTGHRTVKSTPENITAINQLIDKAIVLGIEKFYIGMAIGLDLLAAEILIQRNLPFIAAIPCEDHPKKWPIEWQEKWANVRIQAESEIVLYPTYTPTCLNERNHFMIRNSHLGLAAYDGSSGGTQNAINDALKARLTVFSFNPQTGNEFTYSPPLLPTI